MTIPNSDPTFRNYTSKQAATYAAHRLSYPAKLYETVINHHEKTGGQFNRVLDLGCGPGNATRDIAGYFEEAIGCDAGEAMIGTAREMGGKTKSGKDIVWVIGSGEEFTGLEEVGEGTLDLITVAMAVCGAESVFVCMIEGLGLIVGGFRYIGLIWISFGRRWRKH